MSAGRDPALASQLRLVRDAVAGLDGGDAQAVAVLLAELIAESDAPAPVATVAAQRDHARALETAALAERAPRAASGPDEALDRAVLADFLNTAVAGEGTLTVRSAQTVSRGMSKKTVLAELEGARVLPARIALRVDRSANNYLGTTVLDEWGPLQRLWAHGARIAQPFALEASGSVIGDPFIVSAAVDGVPVGGNYAMPPRDPALIADVAACMAGVHAVPVADWPLPGQPQGDAFFAAQHADYLADWQALGEDSAIIDGCFAWIDRHRDLAHGPEACVHDDFNFNNMLVADSRVTAVLDWEFVHVGTPAADLAYFRYAAEAGSSFEDFLAAYAAAGGTVPPREQLDFYLLWGQLRLGVMGFKAVRNLELGHFDNVRYGMARWHRRQALLRLAELLDQLGD